MYSVARACDDMTDGTRSAEPTMTEKSLWEHQRARHRRAEEVLTRLVNNAELMTQVQASLEAIERGARGTPLVSHQ